MERHGKDSIRHEVAMDADHQLGTSQYLPLRRVSCDFDRGVLFLRGQLPSFFYKQLAQEAVGKLRGVTQVVNEIEVVNVQ